MTTPAIIHGHPLTPVFSEFRPEQIIGYWYRGVRLYGTGSAFFYSNRYRAKFSTVRFAAQHIDQLIEKGLQANEYGNLEAAA